MPVELCGASGAEGPSEGPGTSELGSSVLRIFEGEDRLPGGSCWSGASGAEGSSEGPGTSELGSSVLRIFEAELVETEDVTAADESAACAQRFPVTRLRTSNEAGAEPSFGDPFVARGPDLEAPLEAPLEDLLEGPLEALGGSLIVAGCSDSSASLGSLETSSASRA